MKTAVQWLFEEYKKREIATDEMVELFEKAEHREKEQIMDAYTADCDTLGHTNAFKVAAEQYYNKNFKSE